MVALLVLALSVSAQTTNSIADSLFQVAQAAYEDGDFNAAELAALRGLRAAEGLDELDLLKFHLLLGFV